MKGERLDSYFHGNDKKKRGNDMREREKTASLFINRKCEIVKTDPNSFNSSNNN